MYRTAGESHGRALIALVEGMPHGVPVDAELINRELLRRQGGMGAGGGRRWRRIGAVFFQGCGWGRPLGRRSLLRWLIRITAWMIPRRRRHCIDRGRGMRILAGR